MVTFNQTEITILPLIGFVFTYCPRRQIVFNEVISANALAINTNV